jgi:Fe-S-cluster-containing dehydrogenase component
MKANYGYLDGSGQYFITIDTDLCLECKSHDCVPACPKAMFQVFINDYDEEVAEIREEFRKKLKYECTICKPVTDRPPLPCQKACKFGAIAHSW